MDKLCEQCSSDQYCTACSTCFDCIEEIHTDKAKEIADLKAQVAELAELWNDDYENVYGTPFSRAMDKLAEQQTKDGD